LSGRISSPHCDARGTTFIAASPIASFAAGPGSLAETDGFG
jgi:hypothetical protein